MQACPSNEYYLDKVLYSLPESLDATYERILYNIPKLLIEDARRILTLLCFSLTPLTVHQLVDGLAVDISGSPGLNRKRRINIDDIRDFCPGLIDFERGWPARQGGLTPPTVKIAHFSIQEYLESERIRHQTAAIYGLNSTAANKEIAQVCLLYLLEAGRCSSRGTFTREELPLAYYAARYWNDHRRLMAERSPEIDPLILKLFQCSHAITTWVQLFNPDVDSLMAFMRKDDLDDIAFPIYYASLLGFDYVLSKLLTAEKDTRESMAALSLASTSVSPIHTEDGTSGSSQEGVPAEEYDAKMQRWLQRKGDVNAQVGTEGNALSAAAAEGYEGIVKILLDNGANINAQGGTYDNALQAASFGGHTAIARLLLERGADIHAQGGMRNNALQAASFRGHYDIVKLLLERGAEVNAQGGEFGNALQAASSRGHERIMILLLQKGADVNAQGGVHGNALQAASLKGHEHGVSLLLQSGADVQAQGGRYGNALQAASASGNSRTVDLLLERGAEVNAQGGYFGNALQAASTIGHEKILLRLLQKGADVNAQGGEFGSALKAASARSNYHERVVELLLQWGATNGEEAVGPDSEGQGSWSTRSSPLHEAVVTVGDRRSRKRAID